MHETPANVANAPLEGVGTACVVQVVPLRLSASGMLRDDPVVP
jgi:hypothetical protein